MIITRKSYNDENKCDLFTCIIKNKNRNTIENFDATDILPLVDNDPKMVVELLKAQGCEVLTPVEGRALDIYRGKSTELMQMTEAEFDHCVKSGITFKQLLEIRAVYEAIKDMEVRL